ncbi:Uncharacterised protein [Yersinia frederiksenii]|nr:Uncharacterised protein [Yersinia frederiksenii]
MKINFMSGAIVSAYLLICGVLYLWGFWMHFGLNILQFVDTSDIVKATLIPVVGAIIMFIVQALLNEYNAPKSEQTKRFIQAGGVFKIYAYFQYTLVILMGVGAVLLLGYALFTVDRFERYCIYALGLGFVVFYMIQSKTTFLSELNQARGLVLFITSLLPALFFSHGIFDGKNVFQGVNTYLVDTNTPCSENKNEKFRYIANLSNKMFSLSLADGSICIQNYEYLRLKKENAKPEPVVEEIKK